jgi:hypothetical protein
MTGSKISTVFESLGNIELLSQKNLAVFSSRITTKRLDEEATLLFNSLRSLPLSIAGGWQAPLEKKLIDKVSVNDAANFVYYLNKDINQFPLKKNLQQLLKEKKLLLVSPELRNLRANTKDVQKRDELLFAQIKNILFLHIHAGGLLENYFYDLSEKNYQVFLLNHPDNAPFFNIRNITLLDGKNNQDLAKELLAVL